jgi:hypothetical protein
VDPINEQVLELCPDRVCQTRGHRTVYIT